MDMEFDDFNLLKRTIFELPIPLILQEKVYLFKEFWKKSIEEDVKKNKNFYITELLVMCI